MGTRLLPLTKITNKQLLPVYNRPMIYYPIQLLVDIGIREVMIISGLEHAGHFLNLLGSGRDFGINLSYKVQEEAGGIAQALSLAEKFANKDKVVVTLGDNIFSDIASIKRAYNAFRKQKKGAKIFLKEVPDANRFGVAEIKEERIVRIVEKPKKPKSNLAVTGLYMYDNAVFNIIKRLKPSGRGELEITDVNNTYVKKGTMTYQIVGGDWTDAGTFESLLRAANIVSKKSN